jgi:hypothetical protein
MHFLLLSAAIHLLTRETVGETELTAASEYLEDFCKEAEVMYGNKHQPFDEFLVCSNTEILSV